MARGARTQALSVVACPTALALAAGGLTLISSVATGTTRPWDILSRYSLFDRSDGRAAVTPATMELTLSSVPAEGGAPAAAAPPEAAARTCGMRVCRLRGDDLAPRLFVDEHTDGVGHRLQNIINGMAVAVKNGMNFGGVIGDERASASWTHGHDFRRVVNLFFGQANASSELFIERADAPNFSRTFRAVRLLEQHRRSKPFARLENIYCPAAHKWASKKPVSASSYFTPELVAELGRPLLSRHLDFAPGRMSVAFHVRRGDVNPARTDRLLADDYFYGLAERIRRISPTADIHVFSSTVTIRGGRSAFWNASAFDGYRARGMRVRLDGDDLMVPLAHLARADVLVMSRSDFSYVAAVANPHCVIHPGEYGHFTHWVNGHSDGRASYDSELDECVFRGWRHV